MKNTFHFEDAETPYNFRKNSLFGDRHDLASVMPLVDEALATVAADSVETSVSAGYLYDRKGYDTVDLLGHDRNRSYGCDGDDLLVQVTYRVTAKSPTYEALQKVDSAVKQLDQEKVLRESREQYELAEAALRQAEQAFIAAGGSLPNQ